MNTSAIFTLVFFMVNFGGVQGTQTTSAPTASHNNGECPSPTSNKTNDKSVTQILTTLLRGYDKDLHPAVYHRKPTVVTIGMWITNIDGINVANMDYSIDIFFRQGWEDPRLRHPLDDSLSLAHTMMDKIWLPDTCFENAKSSTFRSVTVPNQMIRIEQNGGVIYNARISLKVNCPMDLHDFPVDQQKCFLLIGSCGSDIEDITYQWETHENSVFIAQKMKNLPQYQLKDFKTHSITVPHIYGNWSLLKVEFKIHRQLGHFVFNLYAPCILVVVLSWITFFIPQNSIAARIALGITSLLTTTTILNNQNQQMPKVSYIKLADWYLIVCFLFVFGTLVEYTVILLLSSTQERIDKDMQKLEKNEKRDAKEYEEYLTSEENETEEEINASNEFLLQRKVRKMCDMEEDKDLPQDVWRAETLSHIDEYSRVFFPLSFIVFNSFYWWIIGSKMDQD